jgi:thioredoxin 1
MALAKTGGKVLETAEAFSNTVLKSEGPILVFFTAPWCGPCRLSVPVVKEIMKEFAGRLEVVEVCTDDLPQVAADANVLSIPTIQIYAGGGEVMDTIVGCVAKTVLSRSIDKVLEDMLEQRAGTH